MSDISAVQSASVASLGPTKVDSQAIQNQQGQGGDQSAVSSPQEPVKVTLSDQGAQAVGSDNESSEKGEPAGAESQEARLSVQV